MNEAPVDLVEMDLDGCAGLYAYAVKLGPEGRAGWDYSGYVANVEPYLRWLAESRARGGADALLGHLLQKAAILALDTPESAAASEAGHQALMMMARSLSGSETTHEALYHATVANLTSEASAEHAAALAGEGISIEPHRDPAKLMDGLAAIYLPGQGGTEH